MIRSQPLRWMMMRERAICESQMARSFPTNKIVSRSQANRILSGYDLYHHNRFLGSITEGTRDWFDQEGTT